MYKYIDFTKTGGFPLTQDVMAFLQDSYDKVFGSIAQTLGQYNILTGCTFDGGSGSYGSGWITYNGEVLPFVGAPAVPNGVIVVESAHTVTYRDTSMNAVIKTRYATLGSGGIPITSFSINTLASLKNGIDGANAAAAQAAADAAAAQSAAAAATSTANNALSVAGSAGLPSGTIILWSGSVGSIPSGFVLCNGGSGTPDLRDRFVVGAGLSYSPGNTGGANGVTLTTPQIPTHTHTVNGQTGGDNNDHSNNTRFAGGDKGVSESAFFFAISSGSAGGNQSHENRPPYYALCYIMKT